MLCVNHYPREYVEECRNRFTAQLASYQSLLGAAGPQAVTEAPKLAAAVEAFEPQFFNHLILALDQCFVHRTRALELKDGNPLNEVRMLCASIMSHHGVLTADKSIKYRPEKSVLQFRIGDEIRVNREGFERLIAAFFADLEAKFVQPQEGA